MNSKVKPSTQAVAVKRRVRPLAASIILIGGLVLLAFSMALSISVGAKSIPLETVWTAVFHFDKNLTDHQIVWELRLPRTITGALVGAAFAVAGALMQGMTRNPLADPGLLGINAGAALALAICFAFLPGMSYNHLIWFSFIGAALATLLVYGISSMARGGMSPVRLALAGATISAWLIAVSEGIALRYRVSQNMAFWFAGGTQGVKWSQIDVLIPWICIGLVGAVLMSKSITLLSLGDETAAGLGQRTGWVKLIGAALILILAGASVSTVGMISFIGLMIPHIARYLVGVSYRWIIPCSAVLGSLLLVLSDIGARMIKPGTEVPVGAIIAMIGVPFFLYLARRERREL